MGYASAFLATFSTFWRTKPTMCSNVRCSSTVMSNNRLTGDRRHSMLLSNCLGWGILWCVDCALKSTLVVSPLYYRTVLVSTSDRAQSSDCTTVHT